MFSFVVGIVISFINILTERIQGYRVLLNLDRLSDAPRLPTSQTSTNESPFQFTTMIRTDREATVSHSYELSTFNAQAGPSRSGG